jgi:ATP-dependent DNA ligase
MRTNGLPGIFEETIFSSRRRIPVRSAFIKAMHPKTEVSPTPQSIQKLLKAGWIGQTKIHGHRAQIHLSAEDEEPIAYNRLGKPHKKLLPPEIVEELVRVFQPKKGWTVLDVEWLKLENKLFIFDILKSDDELLRRLTYEERYKLLPRSYISPYIQTLPLFSTVEKCMAVLAGEDEHVEGLVFKALKTKGFEDTSIVRCRKKKPL